MLLCEHDAFFVFIVVILLLTPAFFKYPLHMQSISIILSSGQVFQAQKKSRF
jgi:hypothetical protein